MSTIAFQPARPPPTGGNSHVSSSDVSSSSGESGALAALPVFSPRGGGGGATGTGFVRQFRQRSRSFDGAFLAALHSFHAAQPNIHSPRPPGSVPPLMSPLSLQPNGAGATPAIPSSALAAQAAARQFNGIGAGMDSNSGKPPIISPPLVQQFSTPLPSPSNNNKTDQPPLPPRSTPLSPAFSSGLSSYPSTGKREKLLREAYLSPQPQVSHLLSPTGQSVSSASLQSPPILSGAAFSPSAFSATSTSPMPGAYLSPGGGSMLVASPAASRPLSRQPSRQNSRRASRNTSPTNLVPNWGRAGGFISRSVNNSPRLGPTSLQFHPHLTNQGGFVALASPMQMVNFPQAHPQLLHLNSPPPGMDLFDLGGPAPGHVAPSPSQLRAAAIGALPALNSAVHHSQIQSPPPSARLLLLQQASYQPRAQQPPLLSQRGSLLSPMSPPSGGTFYGWITTARNPAPPAAAFQGDDADAASDALPSSGGSQNGIHRIFSATGVHAPAPSPTPQPISAANSNNSAAAAACSQPPPGPLDPLRRHGRTPSTILQLHDGFVEVLYNKSSSGSSKDNNTNKRGSGGKSSASSSSSTTNKRGSAGASATNLLAPSLNRPNSRPGSQSNLLASSSNTGVSASDSRRSLSPHPPKSPASSSSSVSSADHFPSAVSSSHNPKVQTADSRAQLLRDIEKSKDLKKANLQRLREREAASALKAAEAEAERMKSEQAAEAKKEAERVRKAKQREAMAASALERARLAELTKEAQVVSEEESKKEKEKEKAALSRLRSQLPSPSFFNPTLAYALKVESSHGKGSRKHGVVVPGAGGMVLREKDVPTMVTGANSNTNPATHQHQITGAAHAAAAAASGLHPAPALSASPSQAKLTAASLAAHTQATAEEKQQSDGGPTPLRRPISSSAADDLLHGRKSSVYDGSDWEEMHSMASGPGGAGAASSSSDHSSELRDEVHPLEEGVEEDEAEEDGQQSEGDGEGEDIEEGVEEEAPEGNDEASAEAATPSNIAPTTPPTSAGAAAPTATRPSRPGHGRTISGIAREHIAQQFTKIATKHVGAKKQLKQMRQTNKLKMQQALTEKQEKIDAIRSARTMELKRMQEAMLAVELRESSTAVRDAAAERMEGYVIAMRLGKAAKEGDLERIKSLSQDRAELEGGGSPDGSVERWVNRSDSAGSTAIFHATWTAQQGALQMLFDLGAQVNQINNRRNTALHLACDRQHYGVIRQLLSAGANPLLKNYEKNAPFEMQSKNSAESLEMALYIRQCLEDFIVEHKGLVPEGGDEGGATDQFQGMANVLVVEDNSDSPPSAATTISARKGSDPAQSSLSAGESPRPPSSDRSPQQPALSSRKSLFRAVSSAVESKIANLAPPPPLAPLIHTRATSPATLPDRLTSAREYLSGINKYITARIQLSQSLRRFKMKIWSAVRFSRSQRTSEVPSNAASAASAAAPADGVMIGQGEFVTPSGTSSLQLPVMGGGGGGGAAAGDESTDEPGAASESAPITLSFALPSTAEEQHQFEY